MSQHIEIHAANIIAPELGSVKSFSTTTTDLVETLSATSLLGADAGKGGFVTVVCDGADAYIAFGSSVTGPAASIDSTSGWLLKDGVPQSFRLRRDSGGLMAKLHHVATAAARIIVYVSSSVSSVVD